MSWEIDLKSRTAESGGFVAKFSPLPAGSKLGADCLRDSEGIIWRGKIAADSAYIRDETLRMHMLSEAADAYGKAMRKAINPFPAES